MMRIWNKAALVPCLLSSAGAHNQQSIPPKHSRESHSSVDLQYLINSTVLTPEMKNFWNWNDAVQYARVYSLPCEFIDVNGDRYEGKKSTNKSTRKARNAKGTAKSKESKKKIKKTAVEKVIDWETKLPSNQEEMKLLLSHDANKQRVQLLLGTDLIQNAPQTKTITVSGVYEELRTLKTSDQTSALMSDLPRSVI